MRWVFDEWAARKAPKASSLSVCAFLLCITVGGGAAAQAKKSRADALFEEGKALLQAGDWTQACAKFQASFDEDAAVSTSIKLARCHEHDGKLVAALAEYRRARELNETRQQNSARKKELEELIATDVRAIEPRVAKLSFRITPAPETLEVKVDGVSVPRAALSAPVEVDPGEREVVVRAPGYREERLKPKLPEGVTHELVLALVAEAPPVPVVAAPMVAPAPAPSASAPPPTNAVPPATATPRTDAKPTSDGSGQRTIGLVAGGAGIVALGVAGYFGIKTLVLVNEASPHCPNSECDDEGYRMVEDANTAQTIGFVVAGVGAALVGTGIAIYVTAPSDGAPKASAVLRLSPSGATVGGAF